MQIFSNRIQSQDASNFMPLFYHPINIKMSSTDYRSIFFVHYAINKVMTYYITFILLRNKIYRNPIISAFGLYGVREQGCKYRKKIQQR